MATVSYANIRTYVSIGVSNLCYEGMYTFIPSIYMQLGKNYSMCRMLSFSKEDIIEVILIV